MKSLERPRGSVKPLYPQGEAPQIIETPEQTRKRLSQEAVEYGSGPATEARHKEKQSQNQDNGADSSAQ